MDSVLREVRDVSTSMHNDGLQCRGDTRAVSYVLSGCNLVAESVNPLLLAHEIELRY